LRGNEILEKREKLSVTQGKRFFNLKDTQISLLIAGVFCLLGLLTVGDYGLTMDFPFYFYRGEAYLNFFLTGKQHFDEKKIKCRFQDELHNPFNYDLLSRESTDKKKMLYIQTGETSYGGFTAILSAVGCELFFKRLNVLSDIEAHHFAYVILASVSIFVYFLFVSRAFNRLVAFLATIFLILFPRFIGHIPNNPKDSVVACLGIMAIYLFWRAVQKNEWKYLIPTAVLISFAVTTKFSGYMIPCILFLWLMGYFVGHRKISLTLNRGFWFCLSISFLVFILLIYIFSPIRWVDPLGIFRSMAGLIKYSYKSPVGWTSKFTPTELFDAKKKLIYAFFPMGLVFITTPIFTLSAGIIGFFVSLKKMRENFFAAQIDNYLLIILWFLIPIIIASLPGPSYYVRTLRHFMLFMPALCILAALGVKWFIEFLGSRLSRTISPGWSNLIIMGTVCLGFVSIVLSIVDIHPYETTFFNRLIGGVSGARRVKLPGGRRGIPFATDFWCNSYRSGMKWLNENALPNSYLTVTFGEQVVIFAKELRDDITIIREENFSFEMLNKGPFYVMIIPTYWEELHDGLLQYCYKNSKPVYTIKSQGAPILLIYKV
jgi:hypothetical protein